MPYDKGDFTQQGVNGDVSALVRLNEKRVIKVVLSSDDESDNCDISGKVYDLLNGTSYDIGSGVSGNIEITENGENINVAPYATATVNVSGGSGLPDTLCQITAVNNSGDDIFTVPCCTDDDFTFTARTINDNSSLNIIGFYAFDEYFNGYLITKGLKLLDTNNSSYFSDLVNLTALEDDGYYYLKVTDPTLPSSATINALIIRGEA